MQRLGCKPFLKLLVDKTIRRIGAERENQEMMLYQTFQHLARIWNILEMTLRAKQSVALSDDRYGLIECEGGASSLRHFERDGFEVTPVKRVARRGLQSRRVITAPLKMFDHLRQEAISRLQKFFAGTRN